MEFVLKGNKIMIGVGTCRIKRAFSQMIFIKFAYRWRQRREN